MEEKERKSPISLPTWHFSTLPPAFPSVDSVLRSSLRPPVLPPLMPSLSLGKPYPFFETSNRIGTLVFSRPRSKKSLSFPGPAFPSRRRKLASTESLKPPSMWSRGPATSALTYASFSIPSKFEDNFGKNRFFGTNKGFFFFEKKCFIFFFLLIRWRSHCCRATVGFLKRMIGRLSQ